MTTDSARPRDAAEIEMAGYLSRVATGPHLSKDLERDEARAAMELIVRGQVDRVQAAVFLAALRMKRETHDELCGVLDALRGCAVRVRAEVDDLVDMAEPYNGYVRHLSPAAFVPAVLAACGVPVVVHGCKELGPKWGLTVHRVLDAAGIRVDMTPSEAAEQVAGAGWAYVDVSSFCAPLHGLARLRTLIVKRPCLSLLEKLIAPITARQRTHLWIGYAHREYPDILSRLARASGYDSMLAVRGVEAGVLTSLTGRVRGARYMAGGELEDIQIAATEVVPAPAVRAQPLPTEHPPAPPPEDMLDAWATAAADAGYEALGGEAGPFADSMALAAAAMLRHLGRAETLARGAAMAREAVRSGEALARFKALSAGAGAEPGV